MKSVNVVLALLLACSLAVPFVEASTSSVQTNYGIWFFNLPPMRGEIKIWIENTTITNDITDAIHYAQGALTQWAQEYPAYALNITYTVHVQSSGEAGPLSPKLNLQGALDFVKSSPYDVFIIASRDDSTCSTGMAYMNPPIIEMTYSNMPQCQGIGYSITIHELGHQVLELGDLYNAGLGQWLTTHPLINGEIMQGTPSFQSYSTLDFYGAWKQEQLYKKYGANMPAGVGNPIYLPGDVPYKWYCSPPQIAGSVLTGPIHGCTVPPTLMWSMCPNPRENCLAVTTTTTSETTASETTNTTNLASPIISMKILADKIFINGVGFTGNSIAHGYIDGVLTFDTGTTLTGQIFYAVTDASILNGTHTIRLVDASNGQQSNSLTFGSGATPEFPATSIILLILVTASVMLLRKRKSSP